MESVRSNIRAVTCGMLVVICLFSIVSAAPIPLIPCEFYGTLQINGLPAPEGTMVKAFMNGVERGSLATTISGKYGDDGAFDPRIIVAGTESDPGQVILFTINGNPANETAVFREGEVHRLNLSVILSGHPIAGFTSNATSGFSPFTVKFTDISVSSPTGWFWQFGDGGTTTLQNPLHIYLVPGTYDVSLQVQNTSGLNQIIKSRYITVFPRGDFNSNWRVDIGDVTSVAYMVVRLIPQDPRADFHNGNGTVEGGDAAKIAWYYVGKVPAL